MGLVVAITIGLVAWLVLWAVGAKSLDAFIITMIVALLGATVRILTPYLPRG